MTDPVTAGMAGVGIVGSLIGGITGAAGAEQSAAAQAGMYQYKAGVALMNQKIAKQNAAWATNAGEISAQESELKTAQEIGQTKVMQSGSGLDVNSGSAVGVRQSQSEAGAYDADIIRANAAHAAYGYETKAAESEAEANLDQMAAANVKTAGDISAFSSILGGVTSVASKWTQGTTVGFFGGGGGDGAYAGKGGA